MRVLCTGFEPFGGSPENPSKSLVEGLSRHLKPDTGLSKEGLHGGYGMDGRHGPSPHQRTGVAMEEGDTGVARGDRDRVNDPAHALPPGIELDTLVLPVTTGIAAAALIDRFETFRPHAVLLFGESAAASAVTLERVAINLRDFRIPDESGTFVRDEPVVPGGPAAYFATLPVRELQVALRSAGIPVDLSYSAGTYLCNEVSYALLHHAASTRATAAIGFVHLPRLPQQVLEERSPRPSMAIETMLRAARAMLGSLSQPA